VTVQLPSLSGWLGACVAAETPSKQLVTSLDLELPSSSPALNLSAQGSLRAKGQRAVSGA